MKTTIKVRKFWGNLNPVTKKIDSNKIYSRKQKFQKKFDGEWILLYLVSTMIEGLIAVNKVTVTKPISIEGDLYIEVAVPNGWDDVKKLVNKVIEVNSLDFNYTGWNSDRNIACFKHNHRTIGIIKN